MGGASVATFYGAAARRRWIGAHCAQGRLTDPLRPVRYAYYHC
jgi:hypothetical protein